MTKDEFLYELRIRLVGLTPQEIQQALDYYAEQIDDRLEDGLSQEAAVASLEHPADIATLLLESVEQRHTTYAAASLAATPQADTKKKSSIPKWFIIFVIAALTVWLWGPALLALLAIIASILMAWISLIISGICIVFGSALIFVSSLVNAFFFAGSNWTFVGNAGASIIALSVVLISLSLTYFMSAGLYYTIKHSARGIVSVVRKRRSRADMHPGVERSNTNTYNSDPGFPTVDSGFPPVDPRFPTAHTDTSATHPGAPVAPQHTKEV